MPLTAIEHLERENILPIKNLPEAQDVRSLGVMVEDIVLPASYTIQWLADQLAERLYQKAMLRGIHPGHCSVLYDHAVKDKLFPANQGGLSTFLEMVNSSLRTIPGTRQSSFMLQLTQSIKESLLYDYDCNCGSQNTSTTPLAVSGQLMSPSDAEGTVEYKTQMHSEVIHGYIHNRSFILRV